MNGLTKRIIFSRDSVCLLYFCSRRYIYQFFGLYVYPNSNDLNRWAWRKEDRYRNIDDIFLVFFFSLPVLWHLYWKSSKLKFYLLFKRNLTGVYFWPDRLVLFRAWWRCYTLYYRAFTKSTIELSNDDLMTDYQIDNIDGWF